VYQQCQESLVWAFLYHNDLTSNNPPNHKFVALRVRFLHFLDGHSIHAKPRNYSINRCLSMSRWRYRHAYDAAGISRGRARYRVHSAAIHVIDLCLLTLAAPTQGESVAKELMARVTELEDLAGVAHGEYEALVLASEHLKRQFLARFPSPTLCISGVMGRTAASSEWTHTSIHAHPACA